MNKMKLTYVCSNEEAVPPDKEHKRGLPVLDDVQEEDGLAVADVQEKVGLVKADVQNEVGLEVADVSGDDEPVPPDKQKEGCPDLDDVSDKDGLVVAEVQEEVDLVVADVHGIEEPVQPDEQDEVGLGEADVFGKEEPVPPNEQEEDCHAGTDDNNEDNGNQADNKAGPGPDDARDEGDPAETVAYNNEPLSTWKNHKQVESHPVLLETGEEATQKLVLDVPVEEEQHSKQAAEQDDVYANHCKELSLDEQPRAQTTTPTRSLPPTTRPAGAGGQCRAGPSKRLVAMSSVLCFTPPFLCAIPELSKDDEKELPKNVVDPLYTSSPLSILQPNNLAQYENKPEYLSLYEKESPSVL